MYMPEQVRHSKRSRLVADLAESIRAGRLEHGERLPGENQLAARYEVSRGTVRSALAELQRRELITTETGVGSFVTFDGKPLDQQVGWARTLADGGAEVATELLGISHGGDPAVEEQYGPLVTVRRLRRSAGRPVSIEVAALPAVGALAGLPATGLVDGSITATLRAAGLQGAGGEQWISVEPLDAADAALLDRAAGDLFLRAVRVTRDGEGGLVEHVVSLLDPAAVPVPPELPVVSTRDRALGALYGLAIGDALGMPTQSLSRAGIAERYGVVDRLLPGAPDQPIAPDLPAGTVTDDTEQALLIARLLVAGDGRLDPHAVAAALQIWEQDMIRRGSRDLLGPSTKRALERLAAGEPAAETGRDGTTNGGRHAGRTGRHRVRRRPAAGRRRRLLPRHAQHRPRHRRGRRRGGRRLGRGGRGRPAHRGVRRRGGGDRRGPPRALGRRRRHRRPAPLGPHLGPRTWAPTSWPRPSTRWSARRWPPTSQ